MNDKLKLLPLLALYIVFIAFNAIDVFQGDEGRYVMFAENLAEGFYSPKDDINLWNGPGYPIVLLPFVLLKLPWLIPKLMNAVFLFMAILYFYSTLSIYIDKTPARRLSYILGIYPPFFLHMHQLFTETVAIFLVCGLVYHFCRLCRNQNAEISWTHLLITSIYLGYLALTKIFFGYVILVGVILFFVLYLFKRTSPLKKTLLVYAFAFLLCLPYLYYTYSLTGKVFYWGNSGGRSLYWLSTPYDDELGAFRPYDLNDIETAPEKHREFLRELEKLPALEQDALFKRKAIENITNRPSKFFKNWVANVGRLLFNYPFYCSHQTLYTYIFIIPNMFLYVFCFIAAYLNYKRPRLISYEIYALLAFVLISVGGSSLVSAYHRFFQPLVAIVTLWLAITLTRTLKVEIKQ